MKKYKGGFIAIFIIILIIVVLWIIKTPITAAYLSRKLKTDVRISNITVKSHNIIINGFKLKNPKKTKAEYAFITDKILINYSFSKVFSSPSIIDNILLENVNLNIACDNPLCTKNNWTTVINNINQKEKKETKKELLIKKLVIKNMNVQITGLGLNFTKIKTSHISLIEFNNISSKNGFPTQQLITAIFRSAGLKDYLKGIIETKEKLEKIIKPFNGISDNSLEESLKSM